MKKSCALFLLLPMLLSAKVLVMTHVFNEAEFIHWQHATLAKFLKDDYEYIVFNDAPEGQAATDINTICSSLNIRCTRVPQSIHAPPYYLPRKRHFGGPSAECAETIQYMYNTRALKHNGIVVIIDADMFLTREFSVEKFLKDQEVAAQPQARQGKHSKIEYFLPNLMFFNMSKLKDKKSMNFNLGKIDGVRCDTAGHTSDYVKYHPKLKWIRTDLEYELTDQIPVDEQVRHYFLSHPKLHLIATSKHYECEFCVQFAFLHFRAGSNWSAKSPEWIQAKKKLLFDALSEILGIDLLRN